MYKIKNEQEETSMFLHNEVEEDAFLLLALCEDERKSVQQNRKELKSEPQMPTSPPVKVEDTSQTNKNTGDMATLSRIPSPADFVEIEISPIPINAKNRNQQQKHKDDNRKKKPRKRQLDYSVDNKKYKLDDVDAHVCYVCHQTFHNKKYLDLHVMSHSEQKSYDCSHCEESFAQKKHFDAHMKVHKYEKPFQCEVCQRKFNQKRYLDVHIKTHTDERPYECVICNHKFTQKKYLDSHFKTHSDEKPYQCEQCQRKFTQKRYLDVHIKTHSLEKPFECGICSHKFTQKKYLVCHLKIHNRPAVQRKYYDSDSSESLEVEVNPILSIAPDLPDEIDPTKTTIIFID